MSAEEFKAKGNAALQAKNFDEAVAMYTRAIELDGSNHVFFSNRSAAFLSRGDAGGALADAEKCIDISPGWAKGFTRKGAALHALKRYDDAAAAYRAGLALAPADAGLKDGLESVEKAKAAAEVSGGAGPAGARGAGGAGAFGFSTSEVLGRLAGHPKFGPYIGDEDFVRKLSLVLSSPQNLMLVKDDPRVMEVFGYLFGMDIGGLNRGGGGGGGGGAAREDAAGGSFGEDDDEDEGVWGSGDRAPRPPSAAAKVGAAASPPPPAGGGGGGAADMDEDEEAEAEDASAEDAAAAEKEREVKRRKKEALEAKKRGNEAYAKKDFDAAFAAYGEAITLDPTNMTFLLNKAAVYLELKEYDRCIELCREAVQVGRAHRADYADVAKAYLRIGRAQAKKGELAAAVESYRTAQVENYTKETERLIKTTELELRKAQAAAYIDPQKGLEAKERGNERFRAGDWGGAIAEYEDAVKRDPTNPAYRNNLAAALSKVLDFNAAKAACEKALELDPKYVKAWAKKGDIELLMKEYHKALDSYKKGLDVEPDNALCTQGFLKTQAKIQDSMGGEVDRERSAHAMADPEIQAILSDPIVQSTLRDFSDHPDSAQRAMADPVMRAKIEKLIAAGVLQAR